MWPWPYQFFAQKKYLVLDQQLLHTHNTYVHAITLTQVALSVDINDVWKEQSKNFPWAKDKALIDLFNLANDAILEDIKTASLYRVSTVSVCVIQF